jgi:hypothetical protein
MRPILSRKDLEGLNGSLGTAQPFIPQDSSETHVGVFSSE